MLDAALNTEHRKLQTANGKLKTSAMSGSGLRAAILPHVHFHRLNSAKRQRPWSLSKFSRRARISFHAVLLFKNTPRHATVLLHQSSCPVPVAKFIVKGQSVKLIEDFR